jgi:hypothetical protein
MGKWESMVENWAGCSRAQTGVEPAIVGGGDGPGVAAEMEIDVDRGAGVADSAGDGDGRGVDRGKQGSGGKYGSKHGGRGRVDFWGFSATAVGARSGGVDAGSEESKTRNYGVLCGRL